MKNYKKIAFFVLMSNLLVFGAQAMLPVMRHSSVDTIHSIPIHISNIPGVRGNIQVTSINCPGEFIKFLLGDDATEFYRDKDLQKFLLPFIQSPDLQQLIRESAISLLEIENDSDVPIQVSPDSLQWTNNVLAVGSETSEGSNGSNDEDDEVLSQTNFASLLETVLPKNSTQGITKSLAGTGSCVIFSIVMLIYQGKELIKTQEGMLMLCGIAGTILENIRVLNKKRISHGKHNKRLDVHKDHVTKATQKLFQDSIIIEPRKKSVLPIVLSETKVLQLTGALRGSTPQLKLKVLSLASDSPTPLHSEASEGGHSTPPSGDSDSVAVEIQQEPPPSPQDKD